MTTTTLFGFIARETEKAIAVVQLPLAGEHKPLWIPRKKIASLVERDDRSASVQLKGEGVRRLAYPVDLEIDAEWLAKIQ
jgi:hypothetical protein